MKKIFVVALFFSYLPVMAQKKANPSSFAKTITADDLKKHLYIIAGKEMEGRGTPSPGLDRAADYIESHFRSLGLIPGNKESYRLPYPLYKDSMTAAAIKVNEKSLEINRDFQPAGLYNYTADMRFSEIVFAGYGIVDGEVDDYKDLDRSIRLETIDEDDTYFLIHGNILPTSKLVKTLKKLKDGEFITVNGNAGVIFRFCKKNVPDPNEWSQELPFGAYLKCCPNECVDLQYVDQDNKK